MQRAPSNRNSVQGPHDRVFATLATWYRGKRHDSILAPLSQTTPYAKDCKLNSDNFNAAIAVVLVVILSLHRGAVYGSTETETGEGNRQFNVVVILVDDLGYSDIGAYNAQTFYETPHIDRLAAQGVQFLDGYAANPVCSPSRYALLTENIRHRSARPTGFMYGECLTGLRNFGRRRVLSIFRSLRQHWRRLSKVWGTRLRSWESGIWVKTKDIGPSITDLT